MLVLTHPQTRLMPGEVRKLLRYIDNGGNLLWLVDAEPLRGLEPLAEKLGITFMPGIVIDPAAQEMNAPLNWTLGTGYPPHAVTRDFDLITVFPDARAISVEQKDDWQTHTLVEGAHAAGSAITGSANASTRIATSRVLSVWPSHCNAA